MRIIAGTHRRRVLETPPDATVTRPMPDMVREALFNLLRGHTEGVAVFDAFAGTGAVGLEALSRGASRCVFVERDRSIGAMLKRNVDALGLGDRAEVVIGDALGIGALARCPRPVHLVFFDPPYPLVRSAPTWVRLRDQFAKCIALLDDTGYAMLRTPWPFEHEEEVPGEASPPTRARRERGGRKRKEEPDELDMDVGFDEAEEPVEHSGGPGVRVPEPPKPPPVRTPGDLRIPGAIGPETHPYGGMALHLYMRDRSATQPEAPGSGSAPGQPEENSR